MSVYVIGAVCVVVFSARRRKTRMLLTAAGVILVASLYFSYRGLQLAWILQALAAVLLIAWLYGRARLRATASRVEP